MMASPYFLTLTGVKLAKKTVETEGASHKLKTPLCICVLKSKYIFRGIEVSQFLLEVVYKAANVITLILPYLSSCDMHMYLYAELTRQLFDNITE